MSFDERFIDAIEEGGLIGAVVSGDIVEEDGETSATDVVECRELIDHEVEILIGIIEVEPRGDGENKFDLILIGGGDQFLQPIELMVGIRLTPLSSMIGIVLWSIDISIEIMLSTEGHKFEALSVRPRQTVEAFDDASDRNGIGANKRRRKQHESGNGAKYFRQCKEPPECIIGLKMNDATIDGRTERGELSFVFGQNVI